MKLFEYLVIQVIIISNTVHHVHTSSLVLTPLRTQKINPDIGKTTPELILSHGYPVENHTITTDDGYILTFFRIPYGKSAASAPRSGKPVALLVHGLGGSSVQWLLQVVEKCLAYQLVEEGYDVWLANSRGTRYSLGHKTMSTANPKYWMFSWEEMGLYDIPAAIDYILPLTGQSQLFYIGHSQGTTQFFVMASSRSEYNSKIKLMSAYAPVAFMSGVRGPIRLFSPAATLASSLGLGNLAGTPAIPQMFLELIQKIAPAACTPEMMAYAICQNVMFLFTGFDAAQTNLTALPQHLSVFPDSMSFNQILHYGQEIESGQFAKFNYGLLSNLFKYGTPIPPKYNIGAISAPIALYWAYNDWLSSPQDVAQFGRRLSPGTLVKNFTVPYATFNHLDYATGVNASELVYRPTIDLMNKYLKM